MKWFWSQLFPKELTLTKEQRRQVIEMAHSHWKREPRYRGALRTYQKAFVPFALLAIFFMCLVLFKAYRPPIHPAILYPAILFPACIWAFCRSRTPFIRRALRDLNYEVCMDCGYWLRELGASVTRCPECGAEREPMSKKANPL